MAMNIEGTTVRFESVIYEDEIPSLRDYLQEKAPEPVTFDFTSCDDVHLAVLQVIMSYKKLYECEYTFSDENKIYKSVLEGFDTREDHCN